MSAKALLEEMLDLLRAQVQAVIAGDHQALLAGAGRHEQLLAELRELPQDGSKEELRPLLQEIEYEKTKLTSLLQSESLRVDFLLRLIIGRGPAKAASYPGAGWQSEDRSRLLNRRA